MEASSARRVSASAEGFAAFFELEFVATKRTVYLIVQSEEVARDVAQEAFIKAYTNWRRISGYDEPGAWVRRVAIRLARRHVRREQLRERLMHGAAPAPATEPAVDPDLYRAIRALAPNQRAAIVLFYFEDRSAREIGDILDCSESTAKVHLHKGRKRLAHLLGEEVADG